MRLEAVQSHALSRSIALPRGPEALCRELRNALRAASDEGVLLTSPHEIFQRVRTLSGPPRNLAEQLRERRLLDRAYCIVGGEKNQDRDRAVSHLLRDDGAWFDFSITVRESAGNLELLAYDFEIRFPAAMGASFLRFDLNLPAHRNEDRELRSHLHVGSDDMYVPAPMMTPLELVALFVYELRRPDARSAWRTPTEFEVEWSRLTHGELAARRPGIQPA